MRTCAGTPSCSTAVETIYENTNLAIVTVNGKHPTAFERKGEKQHAEPLLKIQTKPSQASVLADTAEMITKIIVAPQMPTI